MRPILFPQIHEANLLFATLTYRIATAAGRCPSRHHSAAHNPTNWWVGVQNSSVQLLVYGPGAGTLTYSITYPGVKLAKTSPVENPNYTFLNLTITTSARPGQVQVVGKKGGQTVTRT